MNALLLAISLHLVVVQSNSNEEVSKAPKNYIYIKNSASGMNGDYRQRADADLELIETVGV